MKGITGVKSKELLIWVTVCDMYIDRNDHSKITFKRPQDWEGPSPSPPTERRMTTSTTWPNKKPRPA
ncbi:unnamed protein product [Triticum turgidum subsp. durum]|uniref:Uncharacterized protein n=2 Tax=Triticum TaxID=4564 RepID=A0A9R1QZQ6_TRITD|nr:unnamed protein product [Triticum aestivum]VAH86674.1 unnamed protein product [Triticum turgidum subsp. durum]